MSIHKCKLSNVKTDHLKELQFKICYLQARTLSIPNKLMIFIKIVHVDSKMREKQTERNENKYSDVQDQRQRLQSQQMIQVSSQNLIYGGNSLLRISSIPIRKFFH